MSATIPPGLWASDPVNIIQISDKHFVVVSKTSGRHATLDRNVVSMVQACTVFRTIADHAREVARRFSAPPGNEPKIEQILATLTEQGIFSSAAPLVERLSATRPEQTPTELPIRIVVATCDRPQALERLLQSLAEHRDKWGHEYTIDVVDDSRTTEAQERNAAIVRDFDAQLNVSLVDRGTQRALVEDLASEFPEHRDSFEWLLGPRTGADPDGNTYGVPMNHGILRGWGGRILFLDDDFIIRGWRRKELPSPPGASIGETLNRIHVYRDHEEALPELAPMDEDPFAQHAKFLGSPTAQAIAAAADGLDENLFAGKPPDTISGLYPSASHVRATNNGIFGDPGTVNDLWLLSSSAVQTESVMRSSARYRRVRDADRLVYRGGMEHNFFLQETLQKSTCMGLATGPYMAPVAPAGRGEDGMAASLCRLLYPGDVSLNLPFAMEHRPLSPRKWTLDSAFFGETASVPDVLSLAIREIRPSIDQADPRHRARELSERLMHRFRDQQGLESAAQLLRTMRIEALARQYAALHGALVVAGSAAPPSWKEDVESGLRGIQQQIADRGDPISTDTAERIRNSILRYADGLIAWDKAVSWLASRP